MVQTKYIFAFSSAVIFVGGKLDSALEQGVLKLISADAGSFVYVHRELPSHAQGVACRELHRELPLLKV
jgi:hypothetical protein